MASKDRPYKPSKHHPWNVRARQQVAAQQEKKRRGQRSGFEVGVFESLLEEEERHDREESAALERHIKDFFG